MKLDIYLLMMTTILFGINNKDDDENQEPDQEIFEYWRVETTKEPPEGRCPQTPSIPSRDSRPQRDCSVPEVDGVTHQEDSFSTSSP